MRGAAAAAAAEVVAEAEAEAMEEREWGRGRPPTPYARPRPQVVVVVAYDATKEHNDHELHLALSGVLLRLGDTLLVLGVLHTVTNPSTSSCYLEEEVLKKVELYKSRLLDSAEKCKEVGATMRVKIIAGTPTKMVILQEVFSSKASWVILDRHLRRDYKFYEKHIPCNVALIQDSLSVELLKPSHTNASSKVVSEHKAFYSVERSVQPNSDEVENVKSERSIISSVSYFASLSSQDSSDILGGNMIPSSSSRSQNQSVISYEETQSSKQLGYNNNNDDDDHDDAHTSVERKEFPIIYIYTQLSYMVKCGALMCTKKRFELLRL